MVGLGDFRQRRRFVAVTAMVAAFLSLGYIAWYLRGGPRLSEATTYFMQGRALSVGHLAWTVYEPTTSFRVPLALFHPPSTVAGALPPGYPLLLAIAFKFGAPMIVGPLVAGGIVLATYLLARELSHSHPGQSDAIARLAAGLSLVCAALRYHTADTVAYGASALGVTLALTNALRARRTGHGFLFTGLALGCVVAIRPTSAIPVGICALVLVTSHRPGALLSLLVGTLPGVALLLVANKAATGSFLSSPIAAYFAQTNGPPGCFGYGFGQRLGCAVEQGGFVAAHPGFGFVDALRTTGYRLREHALDIANFEPLALLVLVPIFRRPSSIGVRAALAVVLGQVLLYVPYFVEGTSPGAGARFFADLLPIEHALIALALAPALGGVARFTFARRGLLVLGLAFLGFAVHAARAHDALASSNAGRPAFEPDRAREGGALQGLLYIDSDEGFNLASVPEVVPSHGVTAVRARGDHHDRLVYDLLGHPNGTHRYAIENGQPTVQAWAPDAPRKEGSLDIWRFESEAEWPVAQENGWAAPTPTKAPCASQGGVLTVYPAAPQGGTVHIPLPIPHPASARKLNLVPHVFRPEGGGRGHITLRRGNEVVAEWDWTPTQAATCYALPSKALGPEVFGTAPPPPTSGSTTLPEVVVLDLAITAMDAPVAMDWTEVRVGP
jgi:hypothetical protein